MHNFYLADSLCALFAVLPRMYFQLAGLVLVLIAFLVFRECVPIVEHKEAA